MNNYVYDELEIGHIESFSVEINEKMMELFRLITNDINPLHTDLDYAKDYGYEKNVVYGMLTASFFSTLAGVYLPGKYSLIHCVEIDFIKPVYSGNKLIVRGTVKEKNDLFKTIALKVEIYTTEGIKVCRGKMRIGLLK